MMFEQQIKYALSRIKLLRGIYIAIFLVDTKDEIPRTCFILVLKIYSVLKSKTENMFG